MGFELRLEGMVLSTCVLRIANPLPSKAFQLQGLSPHGSVSCGKEVGRLDRQIKRYLVLPPRCDVAAGHVYRLLTQSKFRSCVG